MLRKSLSLAGGVAVLGAAFGALSFVLPIVGSGLAILATPLAWVGGALAAISAPVWAVIAGVAALGALAYRYWTPIKNFAQGVTSQLGPAFAKISSRIAQLHADLARMAAKKLIDFGRWLGLDGATISNLVAGAKNLAQSVVDAFKGLPDTIGKFLSDVFSFPDYSEADAAGFRAAGERAGRALLDGLSGFARRIGTMFDDLSAAASENWSKLADISVDQLKDAGMRAGQAMVQAIKDAFGALLEWFSGLGGRILSAIGEIDIGSLFKIKNAPSWLPDFLKEDSPDAQLKENLKATSPESTGEKIRQLQSQTPAGNDNQPFKEQGALPKTSRFASAVPRAGDLTVKSEVTVAGAVTVKVQGPGEVVGSNKVKISDTGRMIGRV